MSAETGVRVLKKDPKLRKIIEDVGDYRVRLTRNYYQSLVEAIITQQLAGFAADSIIKKFKKLYSSKLRKTGLSGMKIIYIKELSKKIESKQLKMRSISKLSDDRVIDELTQVKGIGQWTAEMFLIFSLGRLDVLPVGDLGLKKAIQQMFSLEQLPQANEIEQYAERWRPYRTIATWYLWKSLKKFDTIG